MDRFTRAFVVLLPLSLAAHGALAQDAGDDDGGDGDGDDGGALDCAPRCEGDVLWYCDDGAPVSLDCAEDFEGECALLSDEWGFDCVLPEGASCDPGYADGRSRCGAVDEELCCVEGACAGADESPDCRAFLPGAPPRPPMSEAVDDGTATQSCLGLPTGCDGLPTTALLPFALLLLARRRRR